MLSSVIYICMLLFCLSLILNMARLLKGPEAVDRILALDTLYINALALLIIFGIWLGSRLFFEVAMLMALFGFVSTVALCKYLMRGDIID